MRISTTYIFHSVLIVLKWEIVDIQNSELDKGYSQSHNRFKICNSFDSLVKSGCTIFYLTLHIQYPIKIEMKRKIHILFLVRVLSTSVESILRKWMRHENVRIWSGGTVAVKRKTANIKESGQLENHLFHQWWKTSNLKTICVSFCKAGQMNKMCFFLIVLREPVKNYLADFVR